MTSILKHSMHNLAIQNIQCLTQKIESQLQQWQILPFIFYIYETTYSFQLHGSKKQEKQKRKKKG